MSRKACDWKMLMKACFQISIFKAQLFLGNKNFLDVFLGFSSKSQHRILRVILKKWNFKFLGRQEIFPGQEIKMGLLKKKYKQLENNLRVHFFSTFLFQLHPFRLNAMIFRGLSQFFYFTSSSPPSSPLLLCSHALFTAV